MTYSVKGVILVTGNLSHYQNERHWLSCTELTCRFYFLCAFMIRLLFVHCLEIIDVIYYVVDLIHLFCMENDVVVHYCDYMVILHVMVNHASRCTDFGLVLVSLIRW